MYGIDVAVWFTKHCHLMVRGSREDDRPFVLPSWGVAYLAEWQQRAVVLMMNCDSLRTCSDRGKKGKKEKKYNVKWKRTLLIFPYSVLLSGGPHQGYFIHENFFCFFFSYLRYTTLLCNRRCGLYYWIPFWQRIVFPPNRPPLFIYTLLKGYTHTNIICAFKWNHIYFYLMLHSVFFLYHLYLLYWYAKVHSPYTQSAVYPIITAIIVKWCWPLPSLPSSNSFGVLWIKDANIVIKPTPLMLSVKDSQKLPFLWGICLGLEWALHVPI